MKELHGQSLSNELADSDRIAAGIPGQVGAKNILFSKLMAQIQSLLQFTVSTFIKFSPIPKPPHETGILYFDSVEDALTYYNSVSGLSNQIGREIWVRVANNSGSTIGNGQPVYIDSANGTHPTIRLADCCSYDTSRVIGVTTMEVSHGGVGYVTFFGRVNDIDTSSYSLGDILFLKDNAPGEMTDITPTGGAFKVRIGIVSNVSATVGSIEVNCFSNEYTVETISERGFPDRSLLSLSWSDASRTLTITPTGPKYRYYQNGEKYIQTGLKTFQITDVEGSHFIYFNGLDLVELVNGTGDQIASLIRIYPLLAYIYWDFDNKKGSIEVVETHWSKGYGVENHVKDHETTGGLFVSGLNPYTVGIGGDGNSAAHAQFGINSGVIRDEDLRHLIGLRLPTSGAARIFWNTALNLPRYSVNAGYSVLTTGTGRLAYNPTGSALLEVTNNYLVWCHVYAVGSIDNTKQIVSWVGRNQYSSSANAFAGLTAEVVAIKSSRIPSPELVLIASFLFQTNNTYANAVKAKLVAADVNGASFVDWRFSVVGGSGSSGGGGGTTTPSFSFSDADFEVFDNVDATKKVKFQVENITSAITRVATWPDKDGTVAMTSDITSGGHVIQDEGLSLDNRSKLNFVGSQVTVTDSLGTDTTTVTIANEIPTVASGEYVVTKDVDSVNVDKSLLEMEVAAAGLDALSWTSATATYTGSKGQRAYGATYFYECIGTNTWVRSSLSEMRMQLYLTPDIDDSGGSKTSLELDTAYPSALIGQKVWGTTLFCYEKKATNIWRKTSSITA